MSAPAASASSNNNGGAAAAPALAAAADNRLDSYSFLAATRERRLQMKAKDLTGLVQCGVIFDAEDFPRMLRLLSALLCALSVLSPFLVQLDLSFICGLTAEQLTQVLQLYAVSPLPHLRTITFFFEEVELDHVDSFDRASNQAIARADIDREHAFNSVTNGIRDVPVCSIETLSFLFSSSVAHLRAALGVFKGGVRHLCVYPNSLRDRSDDLLLYVATCGVQIVTFAGDAGFTADMADLGRVLRNANKQSTIRFLSQNLTATSAAPELSALLVELRDIADDKLFPLLQSIVVRRCDQDGAEPFCKWYDNGRFTQLTVAEQRAAALLGAELPYDGITKEKFFDVKSYDDGEAQVLQTAAIAALQRRTEAAAQRRWTWVALAALRANATHPFKDSLLRPEALFQIINFAQDESTNIVGDDAESDWSKTLDNFDWLHTAPIEGTLAYKLSGLAGGACYTKYGRAICGKPAVSAADAEMVDAPMPARAMRSKRSHAATTQ